MFLYNCNSCEASVLPSVITKLLSLHVSFPYTDWFLKIYSDESKYNHFKELFIEVLPAHVKEKKNPEGKFNSLINLHAKKKYEHIEFISSTELHKLKIIVGAIK